MATNLWGNLRYGGISATGLLPGRDGESMSPVGFTEAPKYNNRMIFSYNRRLLPRRSPYIEEYG